MIGSSCPSLMLSQILPLKLEGASQLRCASTRKAKETKQVKQKQQREHLSNA